MTRIRCVQGVIASMLLVAGLALATARAHDSGLSIQEAGSEVVAGEHRIHARIDYRLSDRALEALRNGVPLTFEVEAEVTPARGWLPRGAVASCRQVWQLSWDPLSQTYVVRNTRQKTQESFTNLYAALEALGRISDLPLVEESRLEDGIEYVAGLRAGLDQQRLPGPLRLLAFWEDGLDLESDWYRWKLTR